MRRIALLTIIGMITITGIAFAEGKILTNYYPVRLGTYDKLKFAPNNNFNAGTCTAGRVGAIGFHATENIMKMCIDKGGSLYEWDEFGSIWDHNDTLDPNVHNIYLVSNDAWMDNSPNEELRVGVGTSSPRENLHIMGEARPNAHYMHPDMDGIIIEGDDVGLQLIGSNASGGMSHIVMTKHVPWNDTHWFINAFGKQYPWNNRFSIGWQLTGGDFWPNQVNQNEVLSIMPDGKLGINEIFPTALLHVSDNDGDSEFLLDASSAPNDQFGADMMVRGLEADLTLVGRNQSATSTTFSFIEVYDDDSDLDLDFQNVWNISHRASNAGAGNGRGNLHFVYSEGGGTKWWSEGSFLGGKQKFTLDKNGRIGIGKPEPTSAVHIKTYDVTQNGVGPRNDRFVIDSDSDATMALIDSDPNTYNFRLLREDAGGGLGFQIENPSTPGVWSPGMEIWYTWLSIGNSFPVGYTRQHLAIYDSAATLMTLEGPAPEFKFKTTAAGADDFRILTDGNKLQIQAELDAAPGTWKTGLLIDPNAVNLMGTNIGLAVGLNNIGAPKATLHIGGNASIELKDTASLNITFRDTGGTQLDYDINCCTTTPSDGRGKMGFRVDSDSDLDFSDETDILTLWASSNVADIPKQRVGINTQSPQEALHVVGNIKYDASWVLSDARLKKNIAPLKGALDKVASLRGVNYTWKDQSLGDGLQIGVVAQEVEEVFPEVVRTHNDGYKSVAYGHLASTLIEALKELKEEKDAEIERLKKIVAELETKAAAR